MTLVTIVVAADERGGIGRRGSAALAPARRSQTLQALTMGKPMVMGRRTWDSIGRPLPGRHSHRGDTRPRARDRRARRSCTPSRRRCAQPAEGVELCVIGGAEIFAEALPAAGVIELTRVHSRVDPADTYFPSIDPHDWRETHRETTSDGASARVSVQLHHPGAGDRSTGPPAWISAAEACGAATGAMHRCRRSAPGRRRRARPAECGRGPQGR